MSERFMSRLAVFVIVRNTIGDVQLQQRSNTGYLDGYWDFPGGHVEPDEPLRVAAARELIEEVGVAASPDDLRLVHIDQFFTDNNYVNFTFALDNWEGTPAVGEPDKCSAVDFFALDGLPDRCTNAVRVNQQTGFSDELTYSVTNKRSLELLMGKPL